MSMYVGESLVGDGNEIAHIDLLIGSKDGPVGTAFANAIARQSDGHSNLLAVLEPNLAVKPATVMITKVTIKGMRQAVQMFGPAQVAVAEAVADAVKEGVISIDQAEDLVIVCGVFIHPAAEDDGDGGEREVDRVAEPAEDGHAADHGHDELDLDADEVDEADHDDADRHHGQHPRRRHPQARAEDEAEDVDRPLREVLGGRGGLWRLGVAHLLPLLDEDVLAGRGRAGE